jgi:hypothetical protein
MATATVPAVKPGPMLDELVTIADQVEAASTKDSSEKGLAKSLTVMVERLTAAKDSIAKVDDTEAGPQEALDYITNTLSTWSGLLNPAAATELWDADKVSAQLNLLGSMQQLGYLSEDEVKVLDNVGERLSAIRSRRRTPAKPQPIDPSKPAKVLIAVEADGSKVAQQAGNTPTAIQNLRASAKRFIEKATSQKMTAEELEGVTKAITAVVNDGSDEQHFGGLVFTPSE